MSKSRLREARKARHRRVRKRVGGTPDRPRLNVFRSNKHIYAQVIDDSAGRTLAAASSLDPGIRDQDAGRADQAVLVGRAVARLALEKGITRVVFDRGGYQYHGLVAGIASGAREEGLLV